MTTFNSRNRLLARASVSVAFALCTCLIAHGASAAQTTVKTTAVSFADLDLSKAAGAQTLYKRIKVAARRVCGPADRYTYGASNNAFRKCFEAAVAHAVAQVDRPSLTALHQDETSRTARG
jgi:UrcA family protein